MSREELCAGQRFRLPEKAAFVLIWEGQAEIYAVSSKPYRREFIVSPGAGDAAFPLSGVAVNGLQDGGIFAELYTEDGATVEVVPFDACPVDDLRGLMNAWLRRLAGIDWLGRLLKRGDETLIAWRKQTALNNIEEMGELIREFDRQREIFLTLLILRPAAQEKFFQRRRRLRERNIERTAETSWQMLLGEEVIEYAESGETADEFLQEAEFIVRTAAQALNMPASPIAVDSEAAKNLDAVALLNSLARKSNLMLRYVTLPKNWSKKDYGVMIGYLGASKTLAVIVKTNGKDYLIKTAQNPRGMIYDADNENMKVSEAFMCYGGLPEKKIDRAAFRKFLWQNLNSGDLRKMIALSLIMSLIPLIAPPLNEMVFTDAILLVNSSSLIMSAQILAAVGLTMAALSALRSLLVLRLSLRLDAALQAALVGRLLKLPLSALRRFSSDDLADRLERLSRSRDFIAAELTTLTDAVFSLWFLLLMAHYSVKITAAVAAVTLIFGAVLYWHNRRLHEARKKFFAARGRTVSLTHQILDSIGKFRTQAAEYRAFRLWSERFGKQEKLAHDLRLKKELPRLLFQAAPFILTAVICLPFAETEQLSRSKFIAFLVAVAGFGNMIGNFFSTFGRSFELEAHLDALRPLLETVPETTRAKSDAGKLNGSLEVSHLAFAYSEGEDVLRDVNFRLAAGEYAAIVGKSGSGKSTLLRLLLGLETPKSGTIYYDGQDMAELDLASLRQRLGVVWQDGELPAGDIFSLIAGTELITEDEAWEAAEAAGIADDIAAMPMGMHTIIDAGGANLSGGQRQRLQIAGALVGNPAIIVFDEATSALDNRTQATVAATLAKSKATRLIIAHRLSTIREADRIFVLDKGVIAESGTFDELRTKGGLFAELMRPQTE